MGNTVRWTPEQMADYRRRYGLDFGKPGTTTYIDPSVGTKKPTATKAKRSKYGSRKVITVDGQKFDSQKEHDRWLVLQQMQLDGLITDLSRQTRFELAPAVKLDGKTKPALRYFADATYRLDGVLVVEDTKSWITRKKESYRIKKHLMKSVHNLDITET